jgi:flagellar biosynthesis GTPase FlhF
MTQFLRTQVPLSAGLQETGASGDDAFAGPSHTFADAMRTSLSDPPAGSPRSPGSLGHARAAAPVVRTYRGRTLEELIPRIRADLGPDAIILRERQGVKGGIGGFFAQRCVEVDAQAAPRVDVYAGDEVDDLDDLDDLHDVDAVDDDATVAGEAPADQDVAAAVAPSPPAEPAAAAPAVYEEPAVPPLSEELAALATPTPSAALSSPHDHDEPRWMAVTDEPAELSMPAEPAERAEPEPEVAPAFIAFDEIGEIVPDAEPPEPLPEPIALAEPGALPEPLALSEPEPESEAEALSEPETLPAEPEPEPEPAPEAEAVTEAEPAAVEPEPTGEPEAEPTAVEPEPTGGLDDEHASATPAMIAIPRTEPGPACLPASLPAAATRRPVRAPRRRVGFAPVAERISRAALAARETTGDGPGTSAGAGSAPPSDPPVRFPEARDHDHVTELERLLVDSGFTAAAATTLAAATIAARGSSDGAAPQDDMLATIASTLPLPRTLPVDGGAFAIVGAGGAGKTRCVAALAAAHARAGVAAVSVARLGPAGREHELAGLLRGEDVEVIPGMRSALMAEATSAAREHGLVLIDTATASPGDSSALDVLCAALKPFELDGVYVTVPATLTARAGARVVEGFAALRPVGVIATHVDESDQLGMIAQLAMQTGVPVAYLHSGTNLQTAITSIDREQLAARLLT